MKEFRPLLGILLLYSLGACTAVVKDAGLEFSELGGEKVAYAVVNTRGFSIAACEAHVVSSYDSEGDLLSTRSRRSGAPAILRDGDKYFFKVPHSADIQHPADFVEVDWTFYLSNGTTADHTVSESTRHEILLADLAIDPASVELVQEYAGLRKSSKEGDVFSPRLPASVTFAVRNDSDVDIKNKIPITIDAISGPGEQTPGSQVRGFPKTITVSEPLPAHSRLEVTLDDLLFLSDGFHKVRVSVNSGEHENPAILEHEILDNVADSPPLYFSQKEEGAPPKKAKKGSMLGRWLRGLFGEEEQQQKIGEFGVKDIL